jgi:hypothetical protein
VSDFADQEPLASAPAPYPGGPLAAVADALNGRNAAEGAQARAREVEQDEAEHDLVMDQIRAEANELAAVEAHRKILRAAGQDEARARAFQQRVIGWAYVLLVGLLAVVFWILVQVAVEL